MQTESPKPAPAPLSQLQAEEYLSTLEILASELDLAMVAIVEKKLPGFEASVERQRANCARLAEIPLQPSEDTRPMDSDLAARIKDAANMLSTLNKRYSALLKHSGDTMKLFAGLFRSYNGALQQRAGSGHSIHTWSCEL
jgi:hypothetical protein